MENETVKKQSFIYEIEGYALSGFQK